MPALPQAQPAPPAVSVWQWPLFGPITQGFGESLTQYGVHQGIDIDGDIGDRVRARGPGRSWSPATTTNAAVSRFHIDHGDGLTSWYRHLSRIDVAVGARITAATIIGAVEATGMQAPRVSPPLRDP